MENLTGQDVKGYLLKERIGTGGFGAVYRATQSTVGRDVAVKVILPGLASRPEFIRRFETEAHLVARLEHLHITPLYDYWRDPDGAYLVMRYLRGGSLADAIRKEPFTLEAASLLLDQVAAALSLAHRSKIVHRDIKPSNILLDEDGNAYLTDFGIAKDLEIDVEALTNTGAVLGSPEYLAPEQARGEKVTPQTDIYSLGVTLYEMLAGQHPFPGLTPVEQLFKHINDPLPKLVNLEADVADGINSVIKKATAKDPRQRFMDVLEMAALFREAARLSASKETGGLVELLTPREQEVLKHILDGRTNKEISDLLVVEMATVKWYIRQIYKKLNVRSRVQAMVRARELNLVAVPAAESISISSLPEPENPYKGLRAFQQADEQDFFGREKLVRKLIGRLLEKGREARFLALVGPSGSGKSSLAKAGLIPALWRGELPGSEDWYIVDMVPGAHPFDELEVALTRVAAQPVDGLNEQLQRDARGLVRASQLILPDDGGELLLVVDQFEEIFTLVEDEAARQKFLDSIREAVLDPRSRVRVVVTLRADYFDRPLRYPEFGALIQDRVETVLPLNVEELEQAVVEPAKRVGVGFEDGLVAVIVNEMHYQPGALPLLQYALTELFEVREGRMLTRRGYEEIGGAVGALARRADEVYLEQDEAGREALRQMFLRLVTLDEGASDASASPDTRRRTARAELLAVAAQPEVVDDLIDTLGEYRLLSLDNDPGTRAPMVEVAHEAILREWDRLREWLFESRTDIRMQQQLAGGALEWVSSGEEESFLLRGARLSHFEAWAAETTLVLAAAEQRFLNTSLDERTLRREAETARQAREQSLETRSRNFLRALVSVLALATVVATLLSVFAFRQRDAAESEAAARGTQQAIAEEQRAIAEQEAANAFARELALQSQKNLERDPELSMLLSYQSLMTASLPDGIQALREAVHTSRVLQVFSGNQAALNAAAYSPDGAMVATGGKEPAIRVWNPETGEELYTLNTGTDDVYSLDFSPDGQFLAAGDLTGKVIIWDIRNRSQLIDLETQEPVYRVDFSPEGTQLAAGTINDTAFVWNTSTWKQDLVLRKGGSEVLFTPDGAHLIGVTANPYSIFVWDLESGTAAATLPADYRLDVSPDGRFVATLKPSSLGTVFIWDLASVLDGTAENPVFILTHSEIVQALAFAPDSNRLATKIDSGAVMVWDLTTDEGSLLFPLHGHSDSGPGIAWSPDGDRLLTASTDGTARIWDTRPGANREVLTILGEAGNLQRLDYSPDGRLLVVSSWFGPAKIWRPESGELVHILAHGEAGVHDAAFSPEGTQVATVGGDAMVRIWDTPSGTERLSWVAHGSAPAIGYLFPGIMTVNFSQDGSMLITAGADGYARVWDPESGRMLAEFKGKPEALDPEIAGTGVSNAVFSPDGTLVATSTDQGNGDPHVKIFDLETGRELHDFSDFDRRVFGLQFSPDGDRLVVGLNGAFGLAVFDVETGERLSKFSSFPGNALDVAFSPDGSLLASVHIADQSVVWDFASGERVFTIPGHTDFVWGIDFSPDGRYLATASWDGTVRIYTLDTEELLSIALDRLTRWFTLEECRLYLHAESCPPAP